MIGLIIAANTQLKGRKFLVSLSPEGKKRGGWDNCLEKRESMKEEKGVCDSQFLELQKAHGQ